MVATRHSEEASRAELCQCEPRARPILDVLHDSGILRSRALDSDVTTADVLLKVLSSPRHPLFDGRHVFWGVLERLLNPASVTQKVAIPFITGKTHAQTCVACAVVSALISKLPGDYVRMVEGLTSPSVCFDIRRAYPQPEVYDGRTRFLGAAFDIVEEGMMTLWIRVAPDDSAPRRAAEEQAARRHQKYDFTGMGKSNTRHLNDVLIQAALTNYVLGGRYVTEADLNTRTGAGGVPLPGSAETTAAFNALLQDFLAGTRVIRV